MPRTEYVDKKYFDTKFDELLLTVKEGFDSVGEELGILKSDVSTLKSDVSTLKKEVVKIRVLMVDKDYLDRKLGELKGDLIVILRKEDERTRLLIQILKDNKVLTNKDVLRLKEIVIFPVLGK